MEVRTPSSSRIIGAERLSGVRRYTLSDLPGSVDESSAEAGIAPTDEAAFEAGRAQGLREGLRKGLEQAREQAARDAAQRGQQAVEELSTRTARLAAALDEQFAAMRTRVADELIDLAIEIARRTVGAAIETDRNLAVLIAREAIEALLDERSSFTLHVNPGDKVLLDHALGTLLEARGARTIADPEIGAGGCRLVSSSAEIDATLGTRWRKVITAIGRQAPPLDEPEAS